MKNIKKISATLLAILIVVLSLPVATASAATDADLLYGRKLLGQMSDSPYIYATKRNCEL